MKRSRKILSEKDAEPMSVDELLDKLASLLVDRVIDDIQAKVILKSPKV